MLNKACLIGMLGRDPETRTANSGDKIVSFSIATSERWPDKATGERKERTEWHNIRIFNQALGKIAEQYLHKGSKVYIEGQLQTREYTDRDGNQRQVTEIVLSKFRGELVLLDSRGSGNSSATADDQPPANHRSGGTAAIIDDEIPFVWVIALLIPLAGIVVSHVV